MSRRGWLLATLVLLLHLPSVVAANQGPGIESADPMPGSYTMSGPGQFPVEVECADDPDGDDVFVDFIAGGQVIETDEDFWGTSPSYTFALGQPGTYSLQARCRDDFGASAGGASWSVQVAGQASPPPTPQGQQSSMAFDQVTPPAGPHSLPGAGRFAVEVDCPGNNGDQVDFLIDGEVVETDTDHWGTSPSYTFFVVKSGVQVLAARCTSTAGTARVEWTVTVPRPSAEAALLPASDGCPQLADPDSFPDASGDAAQAQGLLVSNADVWHRTGPWTCELAALAEPVAMAYDLDSMLVGVKHELESWDLVGYSAWDFVTDVAPGVAPVWEFFEALLPILQACSTALGAVDAFHEVRTSAILFLADPSQAQLDALKATLLQVLPAYDDWIQAFEMAAAKVAELASHLRAIADSFLAAAMEASDIPILPDVLAFFGETVMGWVAMVQGFADGIDALADPIRADVQVMQAILEPPSPENGAPGLAATWLLAVVAAAALAARRRR